MTEALTVPRGERHVVRVFALAMPADQVRALRNDGEAGAASFDPVLRKADPVAVAALFGLQTIDPAFVELLDASDLAELGLAHYLIEGTAVAEAQIAADRERLDRQRGYVLIAFSRAFAGQAVSLHPDKRLTLIGVYAEEVQPISFDPLPDASAQGVLTGKPGKVPMSDARISGIVAVVVLVLLFVLVAVFVRMAG